MDLSLHAWLLVYGGIFAAALIEGEVTYIAAAALVAEGKLSPLPVLTAGALGAAIGDQAFFYVFRRSLPYWTRRYPSLGRATAPLLVHVRRNATLMVLLIRFAPGLRVALAMACAWVDVPAVKFSLLNVLSSFLWAVVLLVAVAWWGPASLGRFGLTGWKGGLLVGVLAIVALKALGRYQRRALQHTDASSERPAPPVTGSEE